MCGSTPEYWTFHIDEHKSRIAFRALVMDATAQLIPKTAFLARDRCHATQLPLELALRRGIQLALFGC
jgi:hypothetical protein